MAKKLIKTAALLVVAIGILLVVSLLGNWALADVSRESRILTMYATCGLVGAVGIGPAAALILDGIWSK